MERKNFDEKWRDALRDAEVEPSEKVWSNIELDLERAEMGTFRHQLTFYKMVAAASVIFALTAGAAGFYFFDQNQTNQEMVIALLKEQRQLTLNLQRNAVTNHAVSELEEKSQSEKQSELNYEGEKSTSGNISKKSGTTKSARTKKGSYREGNDNTVSDIQVAEKITLPLTLEDSEEENTFNNLPQITYSPTNAFQPEKAKEEQSKEAEVDPVVLMMAKLDKREEELNKREAKSNKERAEDAPEDLWTSVGFAAGSFNSRGAGVSPTSENASLYDNMAARNASKQEATAPGTAYSIGLNVGKRLSRKWVLQSGVSYMNQSSSYTAETAVTTKDYQTFTPESINAFDRLSPAQESSVVAGNNKNANTVITTAPYAVSNSVRYLSVPVQAGYLLIDSKVGLQFNAGFSTDLFLQNTKSTDVENMQSIDEGIGEDTPYRAMNFSGLLGTELSYRFGARYRFAINPGLRYPFNSIYKSDLGVKSSPVTMDIGLRFRYIFQ